MSCAPFTVTVTETDPPVITGCDELPVQTATLSAPYMLPTDLTITDASAPITLVIRLDDAATGTELGTAGPIASGEMPTIITPESYLFATTGAKRVIYVFTDTAGNSAQCEITVTVADDIVPELTGCPSAPISILVADLPFMLPTTITATDSSVPLTLTIRLGARETGMMIANAENIESGASPVVTPESVSLLEGEHNVIYSFTDSAGNSADCAFTVAVVNETDPPVIMGCPSVGMVMNHNVNLSTPLFTFPTTFTATDASAPLTLSIRLDDATTGTEIARAENIASGMPPTLTPAEYPFSDLGANSVIYVFMDANGTSASCAAFTVTVIDNTVPVIAGCPTEPVQHVINTTFSLPSYRVTDNKAMLFLTVDYTPFPNNFPDTYDNRPLVNNIEVPSGATSYQTGSVVLAAPSTNSYKFRYRYSDGRNTATCILLVDLVDNILVPTGCDNYEDLTVYDSDAYTLPTDITVATTGSITLTVSVTRVIFVSATNGSVGTQRIDDAIATATLSSGQTGYTLAPTTWTFSGIHEGGGTDTRIDRYEKIFYVKYTFTYGNNEKQSCTFDVMKRDTTSPVLAAGGTCLNNTVDVVRGATFAFPTTAYTLGTEDGDIGLEIYLVARTDDQMVGALISGAPKGILVIGTGGYSFFPPTYSIDPVGFPVSIHYSAGTVLELRYEFSDTYGNDPATCSYFITVTVSDP